MKVVSFYRFLDLPDPAQFRDELQSLCEEQALLGTILVAQEGFNGTLAGEQLAVETVFSWISANLTWTPRSMRAGRMPKRRRSCVCGCVSKKKLSPWAARYPAARKDRHSRQTGKLEFIDR